MTEPGQRPSAATAPSRASQPGRERSSGSGVLDLSGSRTGGGELVQPHTGAPCCARPTLLAIVRRCADCTGHRSAIPAGVPGTEGAWKADVSCDFGRDWTAI